MSEVYKIVLTTIDMIAALIVILTIYQKKSRAYKVEMFIIAFILLNILGFWI